MKFRCEEVGIAFLDEAPYKIVTETELDASREEVAQTLRERLGQAGQDLSDEEVDRLVSQVTTGDG